VLLQNNQTFLCQLNTKPVNQRGRWDRAASEQHEQGGWPLSRSWKPRIHFLKVHRNPSLKELSQVSFSRQLRPPLGPSLLPERLVASSQFPSRPYKGPNSILSHSHTTPLSLLLWTAPYLPLAHFLTYRHPSPIGEGSPLGLLHNLLSFRARLTHRPDDGSSTHLWNVSPHLRDYTAVHLRRF
jgi:hypothetical protein